jgi:hypothetical protein
MKTEMPWPKRMRRLLAREVTLKSRQRRLAEQYRAAIAREIEEGR